MEPTKDMLGLPLDALVGWLGEHVPGFHGFHAITKFPTGQSNPTYAVEAASGRYVLRAKPPGPLLPSAHQVEREVRVLKALAGSDIPVPIVLGFAPDDQSPLGRAFYVMERVEGRIFWDPALPELSRTERGAIYDAMNAALARLHALDPLALGLADFGRPEAYFERQVARWSRQYAAIAHEPIPDMIALGDWLAANIPPEDGAVALVHGDWRIDNLIFANDRPEIVAVLDWELSTLGHPMADLAYQCMQWRLPYGGGMRGLGGLDRQALGLPVESDYVAAYLRRRGREADPYWPFYLGFAFFRLASILAGVAARAEAGNASNPETARAYGREVPRLAALGRAVTAGEG